MPSTQSPRPTSYLDVEKLRCLVRAARVTRNSPKKTAAREELGAALLAIAGGVWDRYRFTADRDDFVQECALHLLDRPLARADVQKHVFNFFTTCAIRYGWKLRDKGIADRRRFETYAAELVESGRELPDASEL